MGNEAGGKGREWEGRGSQKGREFRKGSGGVGVGVGVATAVTPSAQSQALPGARLFLYFRRESPPEMELGTGGPD